MYHAQPTYRRFNQKSNLERQQLWSSPIIDLTKKRNRVLQGLVQQEEPGYDALAWAFHVSSFGNRLNTGFSINAPNGAGNSWQPLSKLVPTQRWKGTPATASLVLDKVARFYGADLVGFCRLDRRWVYSHHYDEQTKRSYPIKFTDELGYEQYDQPGRLDEGAMVIPKEMQYVVVMIFKMDEDGIATAPTLIQQAVTDATYSQISFTTVMVAEFLRGLGYHAIPSANCTALSIPLAIDAGLGQLGRNAKLITPQFGPRCRIAKVITSLPLEPGRAKDYGVTSFCDSCKKCARICPSGAIPFGERSFDPINECNNAGVLVWQVDAKKCRKGTIKTGTNCGLCIRVCPFNKGPHRVHGVTRWVIKHMPWMNPLIVRVDNALGFGRFKRPERFWGLRWRS